MRIRLTNFTKHLLVSTVISFLLLITNSSNAIKLKQKRRNNCAEVTHLQNHGILVTCCTSDPKAPIGSISFEHCSNSSGYSCRCQMEVWSDRLNCVVRLDSLSERIKSKRSYPLLIGEIMVIEELLSQNLTQSAETQKGMEALVCSELNLTANGRNSAVDFSVTFHGWEQEQCIELLNGLRMYNISAFNLEFKQNNSRNASGSVELANLGLFLPNLRHLTITSLDEPIEAGKRTRIATTTFLRDLNSLESLKIVGVDFEMGNGQEIALWTTTLRRLHIEYSSIRNLPWWLSRCSQLERLIIRHTDLDSALVLSQIQSLSYVSVKANRLTDLSLISFSCESVQEMDLSENNVSKFAQHTFAQCRQLRVLDLSHNAISKLPPKGFTNTKLKHLKLAHNRIKTLKADHLTGLNGLRSLSLSGNPLDGGIDLFAFLPVKWMKSIEMDGCNLTQLPLALTQCCLLTSTEETLLWLCQY